MPIIHNQHPETPEIEQAIRRFEGRSLDELLVPGGINNNSSKGGNISYVEDVRAAILLAQRVQEQKMLINNQQLLLDMREHVIGFLRKELNYIKVDSAHRQGKLELAIDGFRSASEINDSLAKELEKCKIELSDAESRCLESLRVIEELRKFNRSAADEPMS